MMDWNKVELCHREHYKDLLRELDRERLALAGRDPNRHLFCRMLITQGELPSDKPILQPQAQAQGEQVS
jgi:hypothetical protein